jgi:uncharacterized membrane protein
MPSTPNPTTGFLMFVPKKDIILLDMSIEDAAKMVISAGLIAPDDYQKNLATLAGTAAPKKRARPAKRSSTPKA